jgi:hypothetical protein
MGAVSNTRRAKPRPRAAGGPRIYTIKVTLRYTEPPVWRRLEVPSSIRLVDLHYAIQDAFEWDDSHLWSFDTQTGSYGSPEDEREDRDAGTRRLRDVAPRVRSRLLYTYDFGDNWEHDIVVEAAGDPVPGTAYPRCLDGERAGPPEDCGGPMGYERLIEILDNPGHARHENRLSWLGLSSADEFDPEAFDIDAVNARLSRYATVLIKK